jgi:penicillin-binding protein 1C
MFVISVVARLTRPVRSLARRWPVVLAVGLVVAAAVWIRCGPLPAGLLDRADTPSTVVLDRHGERLYEARSPAGLRGEPIDAAHISPIVAAATMAAEDERFRWHPGVDPIAVARAALHDIRAGRLAEGGSTLTQQVADLLLARLDPDRSRRGWRAKLRETLVALRLEHRRSKDEILALYLNLAPYGNQIVGIERAAQAYFGRAASTLTPAEAAFLAALPQQPGRFNPWHDPARARPRQRRVLEAMAAHGWITPAAQATALAERLTLTHEAAALVAPHFVERVLASVPGHPRVIETTIDAALQRTIHGIIEAARPDLEDHHASNVAVAVLDNRTGDWLAWEGSGDYFDADHGGAIDGVVTPRQPGSALKPFTYAAAFERGFTPGHRLADVPSEFPTAKPGILYSPRNYDGIFRGPLLARAALAGSENVPAVVLASEVGVPAIARLLRRAGFTTLDANAAHYGLGLTLGNAEVRLDELVAGYAMIARGGERVVPRSIRAVDGTPRADAGVSERVISERTAFWLTDILSDPDARAYIFGRGGSLDFPFAVAAKTGTSQSYFDNWVVGYTRDVTVGVWVGNFDRTPLRGSSGITGAGPIFHAVMLAAVERLEGRLPVGDTRPIVAPTPDVHRVELCAMSGMRATDACPTRISEWMPAGAHLADCTWHYATARGLVTVWPEAFRDWARAEGLATPDAPPGEAPIAVPAVDIHATRANAAPRRADTPGRLTIRRPLGGAVFLIDPTLRPEFQQLSLSARGGAAGVLTWSVDGTVVGRARADETVKWPLARGRHEVVVRDAAGASARTHIEVR